MKNHITIVVKKTTHKRMKDSATYPRQPFDEIINRLLDKTNGKLD